jgi:catechol 2,3-dioxygenase
MSTDTTFTMPATAHLGRVALRVASLDRVVPFYRDVVGLDVSRDGERAVLSAGETPVVVLHEDADAPARPRDAAGLFHLAVRVPSREALGDALARIEASALETATLTGASDHLVSEAIYLRDPEGNGVEIYRDRPREEWTFAGDRVEMDTLPLDRDPIRSAASGDDRAPPETDLGHVHLEVTGLAESRAFYVDTLGLNVRTESYRGALFVAAGDYHHHVGLNTWNGRTKPVGEHRGVEWFEFVVPESAIDDLRDALVERGHAPNHADGPLTVADPDGIEVRLRSAT